MSVVQQRLDPSVFRLPVERMRDGYYSDQYFNLTRELLLESDRHPRVLMQVFQKEQSLLGGVDEAIAILKQCAGRRRPDGGWDDGWDQLVVHALYEGDAIAPHETVMTIEGDYSLFAHLETVYLGCMARRTLVMRNVAAVVRAQLQQLRHAGDDEGLGDRLAAADAERRVVVGVRAQLRRHEGLARDAPDRLEDPIVRDVGTQFGDKRGRLAHRITP